MLLGLCLSLACKGTHARQRVQSGYYMPSCRAVARMAVAATAAACMAAAMAAAAACLAAATVAAMAWAATCLVAAVALWHPTANKVLSRTIQRHQQQRCCQQLSLTTGTGRTCVCCHASKHISKHLQVGKAMLPACVTGCILRPNYDVCLSLQLCRLLQGGLRARRGRRGRGKACCGGCTG